LFALVWCVVLLIVDCFYANGACYGKKGSCSDWEGMEEQCVTSGSVIGNTQCFVAGSKCYAKSNICSTFNDDASCTYSSNGVDEGLMIRCKSNLFCLYIFNFSLVLFCYIFLFFFCVRKYLFITNEVTNEMFWNVRLCLRIPFTIILYAFFLFFSFFFLFFSFLLIYLTLFLLIF
jgi:hypothetical protein